MLLSVPTRSGFNPYHGYTNRHSKKVHIFAAFSSSGPPDEHICVAVVKDLSDSELQCP